MTSPLRRCPLAAAALLLASCSAAPVGDWQRQLAQQLGRELSAAGAYAMPQPADADPVVGDSMHYAITLRDGEATKAWRLRIAVAGVERALVATWRAIPDFEQRVQLTEASAPTRTSASAPVGVDALRFEQLRHQSERELTFADLGIEAFDAAGASLGGERSSLTLEQLRRGLLPACRAGHRQRDRIRGRVAAGKSAPSMVVDAATLADIRTVVLGVEDCRDFFTVRNANPVTRQILGEVLAMPSLWSILTHWGVRLHFQVDFFAAELVDSALVPQLPYELWSVPVVLLLNDQPGFYASLLVGPSGSPDGAAAGIHGLVARHPHDGQRSLFVRLVATQRGSMSARLSLP